MNKEQIDSVEVLELPNRRNKMSIDPKISVNVIIACLTVLAGTLALIDRFSASASTIAVMQRNQVMTDRQLEFLEKQRFIDRQEILAELREIKAELKHIRNK